MPYCHLLLKRENRFAPFSPYTSSGRSPVTSPNMYQLLPPVLEDCPLAMGTKDDGDTTTVYTALIKS